MVHSSLKLVTPPVLVKVVNPLNQNSKIANLCFEEKSTFPNTLMSNRKYNKDRCISKY